MAVPRSALFYESDDDAPTPSRAALAAPETAAPPPRNSLRQMMQSVPPLGKTSTVSPSLAAGVFGALKTQTSPYTEAWDAFASPAAPRGPLASSRDTFDARQSGAISTRKRRAHSSSSSAEPEPAKLAAANRARTHDSASEAYDEGDAANETESMSDAMPEPAGVSVLNVAPRTERGAFAQHALPSDIVACYLVPITEPDRRGPSRWKVMYLCPNDPVAHMLCELATDDAVQQAIAGKMTQAHRTVALLSDATRRAIKADLAAAFVHKPAPPRAAWSESDDDASDSARDECDSDYDAYDAFEHASVYK